jgi:CRISPR-associated endoribonuclease Cas6
MDRKPDNKTLITFSTIKGTSSVAKGYIRFLSTKVSLVIASNNDEFLRNLVDTIFRQRTVRIGKMELIPKQQHIVEMPEYKTEMKYVCISPIIILDPNKDPLRASETTIDPSSQEFSDILFNTTIERMEAAGYSEEELRSFEAFEAIPDPEYLRKVAENNKRFARYYKNTDEQIIIGYLLPFTLHAHPKVHEFICNCGLGLFTNQGYGMIDVVPEIPAMVHHDFNATAN